MGARIPGTLRDGCRDSSNGASLSEQAHCRRPQGRAPLMGTLCYETKALGMGICLQAGSVGQPGVGLSTRDFEKWLKGALEVERLSLWELCEGILDGGLPWWRPWRIGRKGSGDGCLFPQGPCWGTWKGAHLPGTLRDGWRGSRNGAFLSEEAQWRGPLGRAHLLGTLEDMLRKALDKGISLHRDPFISEGNLESGGGGLYTGDFEWWMREGSRNEASSLRELHQGNLEKGLLYWGSWKMR
jgi:hypothetical protein